MDRFQVKAREKPDWLTEADVGREEREEAECQVCHTDSFIELDINGDEIHTDGGVVEKHENIKIVASINPAGSKHWLIIPRQHIRDIEHLRAGDLKLLQEMSRVRDNLVQRHCPNVPPERIHCGYHRGRRPNGYIPIHMPDIISVQHLHLHVIAEPRLLPYVYKFHPLNPLIFKSEEAVLELVEGMVEASAGQRDSKAGSTSEH